MNELLREFIIAKGMSVNSFSKLIGIGQTTLNQQANGTANVSAITLSAIADKFPEANMRWFLTGKGQMEVRTITQNNTQGDNVVSDCSGQGVCVDTLLNIIKNLQEENANLIQMLRNKT